MIHAFIKIVYNKMKTLQKNKNVISYAGLHLRLYAIVKDNIYAKIRLVELNYEN